MKRSYRMIKLKWAHISSTNFRAIKKKIKEKVIWQTHPLNEFIVEKVKNKGKYGRKLEKKTTGNSRK